MEEVKSDKEKDKKAQVSIKLKQHRKIIYIKLKEYAETDHSV